MLTSGPARISLDKGWRARYLITIRHVGQERTLYEADHVAYWSLTRSLAESVARSPWGAAVEVSASVQRELNLLPSLPLVPVVGLGRGTRLSYLLAVINIYALAALLLLTAVVARLLDERRLAWLSGWGVAAAVLLLPARWQPVALGYLDVGGVAIAALILLAWPAAGDGRGSLVPWLAMGFLLALLAIFRRWWAFWSVSWCAVIALEAIWLLAAQRPRTWGGAWRVLRGPIVAAAAAVATLLAVASGRVATILTADWAHAGSVQAPCRDRRRAPGVDRPLGPAAVGTARGGGGRRPALALDPAAGGAALGAGGADLRPVPALAGPLPPALVPVPAGADHAARRLSGADGGVRAPADRPRRLGRGHHSGRSRGQWHGAVGPDRRGAVGPARARVPDPSGRAPRPRRGPPPARVPRPAARGGAGLGLRAGVPWPTDRHQPRLRQLSLGSSYAAPRFVLAAAHVDRRDGFPANLLIARYIVLPEPVQVPEPPLHARVAAEPARCLLEGEGIGRAFRRGREVFGFDGGVRAPVWELARPLT